MKHAPKPLSPAGERTLGIVGGLGALAGADVLHKLLRARAVLQRPRGYHFLFEQHPFNDAQLPLDEGASMVARTFYAYQVCKTFEASGAHAILLPCFASHTFLAQLQAELNITVLDMLGALTRHIHQVAEPGTTLGIVASDYVRHSGLLERYLNGRYTLAYPDAQGQAALMQAMYGAQGIKNGHLEGASLEAVYHTCQALHAQGAGLIVPGMTELSLVCPALRQRGIAVLDINQIYADFAIGAAGQPSRPSFKLGVVGGVGPAATVDFMAKVVAHTPAGTDQEHIKMVVEQNPQIPDRTAHLLRGETDPTLALYATCKRLERAGADAIAIPCNTAHAFVERLEPRLAVPIVHMLRETVRWIAQQYGTGRAVGLLATAGTVQSRVYHHAARDAGLELITPGPDYQALVTQAIYSPRGIKAGFTDGLCREHLLVALEHLCELGAGVVILGCTELPLVLAHSEALVLGRHRVTLVDPTTVLAQRCVALALPVRQRRDPGMAPEHVGEVAGAGVPHLQRDVDDAQRAGSQ